MTKYYFISRMKILVQIFLLAGLFTASNARAKETGPILVLATDENFGTYTGEILRAEGFQSFTIEALSNTTTLTFLKKFDLVILTKATVSDKQVKMFDSYVRAGGNLIAFHPDIKLNPVFGIKSTGGIVKDGYISINAEGEIGQGLLAESLQIHADAKLYELSTAITVATLLKNASDPSRHPAVVFNIYGTGHAMAFLYNLPESIVYARQGNYRKAGKETDGITGIRAMDLFTDGWVDTSRNILNQADEQMRLLTHGIEMMNSYKKPIPRFWYFPDTLNCLVTLHNDGEDNREEQFQKQFDDVYSKGAKMTLYVKETDLISAQWINGWISKGFEIAGHYDDTKQALNPDWKTMDSVYYNLNVKLKKAYGIDAFRTVTNHWFVWCGKDESGNMDFAAQAKIEEKHGIRLDCNYAHYDNGSNQGHFLGPFGINHGNYTGSGLPMKFAGPEGKMINVYQHFNNVYDQQYMEHGDQEGFFQCFKGLVDRSLDNEVYSYVSIKAHNAEYFFSEKPLMKMLDYAASKNIPVWTELELLRFLQARDEATFTRLEWNSKTLSFTLLSSIRHNNKVSILIPIHFQGINIVGIKANGKPKAFIAKTVKGTEYAQVSVEPGNNYDFQIDYTK